MNFSDFALAMYPYWILGGLMFYAVKKSEYKDLLAFNLKAFLKFFAFLIALCVYRFFMIKLNLHHKLSVHQLDVIKQIPLTSCLFVGWEDLCHSLPIVILKKMLPDKKWANAILFIFSGIITASFGIGHLYQGIFSAMLLSLYIPFGVNFIQKRGASTLMAGHVSYDFLTLLTVKLALLS